MMMFLRVTTSVDAWPTRVPWPIAQTWIFHVGEILGHGEFHLGQAVGVGLERRDPQGRVGEFLADGGCGEFGISREPLDKLAVCHFGLGGCRQSGHLRLGH